MQLSWHYIWWNYYIISDVIVLPKINDTRLRIPTQEWDEAEKVAPLQVVLHRVPYAQQGRNDHRQITYSIPYINLGNINI